MVATNLVYGLSDRPPYEGWDGPNGWRELYFKNNLQNKKQWIFLYTQNTEVEESIFLSYKGQIRAEIMIDGWVQEEHPLLEEYRSSLGKSKDGRGVKPRGYKVIKVYLFEDTEELQNANLSLDLSKIQFGKQVSVDECNEIWDKVGENYEPLEKPKSVPKKDEGIIGFVGKIAWSNNGWTEFDMEPFINEKLRPSHGYVKLIGFGHESWNFNENLGDDWFIGHNQMHRAPAETINDGLIIFISKNHKEKVMYLIGFYGGVRDEDYTTEISMNTLLPPEFFDDIDDRILKLEISEPEIAKDLRKIRDGDLFSTNYQGKKTHSTCFIPEAYLKITAGDVGITKFGMSSFFYISQKHKCKPSFALEMLKEARNKHLSLRRTIKEPKKLKKINSDIKKIELVIEKYFKTLEKDEEGEEVLIHERFDTLKKIIEYKKQVILYGPPGTGKTYLANQYAKSQNKKRKYLLSKVNYPECNYFIWVIQPTNWSKIKDCIDKKYLWETSYSPGSKFKEAFNTLNEDDMIFFYQTNPESKIQAIGECVFADSLSYKVKILNEIDGITIGEMKANKTLKESQIVRSNFHGSLFKLAMEEAIEVINQNNLGTKLFSQIDEEIDLLKFTTFHQSLAYEDFIEGLKPISDGSGGIKYVVEEGIFKRACREAYNVLLHSSGSDIKWNEFTDVPELDEETKSIITKTLASNEAPILFLIIDEINRGDISRIFGELITLMEGNKRLFEDEEFIATLPYSKKKFGVPPNLFIIGTMNTADRSIALLDIALRRRFGFIELMPDYDVLNRLLILSTSGITSEVQKLRKLVKTSLQVINERISKDYNRDHQIGHSYFISLMYDKSLEGSKDKLKTIWIAEIIPLLREYFYDNEDMLKSVLNKVSIEDIEQEDIINTLNNIISTKKVEEEEETD